MKMKTRLKQILALAVFFTLTAKLEILAQPNPPLVDPGTAGQYAIYTAAHRLSPGNGSNVVFLVINDSNFYVYFPTNTALFLYITTNNFTTFTSTTINNTTLNVSGKASVKYFVLTNQVAYIPQAWSGPSNTLDLTLTTGAAHYTYSTVTPVRITGLSFDSGYVEDSILAITNAATTNITITASSGFKFPATDTQAGSYTLTNGDYAEILVDYHNGPSNLIIRAFH